MEDKGINGISVRPTTVIIVLQREPMEKRNSDDLRNKKKSSKEIWENGFKRFVK